MDEIEPVRDSDLTCCISVAVGIKSSLDFTVRFVVVVVVVRRSVVVALFVPLNDWPTSGSPISEALDRGVDVCSRCSELMMLLVVQLFSICLLIKLFNLFARCSV